MRSVAPDLEWLLRQLKRYFPVYAGSVACLTTAALLSLADPLVMKWLIDKVLPQRNLKRLVIAACIFVLIYFLRLLFSSLSGLLDLKATQATVLRLRSSLLQKLNLLSAEYHETRPVGDSQFRIEQDVSQIGELGTDFLVTTVRLMTVSGLTLIMMFILNPSLTVAMVPLIPPFVVLRRHYQKHLRTESDTVQSMSARRSCFLQEHLPAVVQIQLLGLESSSARIFFRLAREAMDAVVHRKKSEIAFGLASISFMFIGFGTLLGYGGYQVLKGTLTVGGLVAFYAYASRVFEPLVNVVDIDTKIHRMRASVSRVLEILNQKPAVANLVGAIRLPEKAGGALELEDVGFAYGAGKKVLAGLTFSVNSGEKMAIIGKTGSGKSTIAKLITRQYEPQDGAIRLNGRNIREFTVESLRANVSLVPQEPILFDGSVRENLMIAKCTVTQRELEEVAELTQVMVFLRRLPKGWNAQIGPHGARLSGGEKQRLALARAMLRNPSILILDESTSALDAETEKLVLVGLEKFLGGRTIIAISHRLSTIKWAKRVLVLCQGRTEADGGYRDLYGEECSYQELREATTDLSECRVIAGTGDNNQSAATARIFATPARL